MRGMSSNVSGLYVLYLSPSLCNRGSLAGKNALGVFLATGIDAGGLCTKPCVGTGFKLNADLCALYLFLGCVSYARFLTE